MSIDEPTLGQWIGSELPQLRRFARAMTGSPEIGDSFVTAALRSILSDRSSFDGRVSSRVALYGAFSRAWHGRGRSDGQRPSGSGSLEDPVCARLQSIPLREREVFLLIAMEEFTPADAAQIVQCREDEIARLLLRAGREIAKQIATTVLIIEDEPLVALDLSDLVESLGHIVVGIASTRGAAVAMGRQHSPGLILADVELADGSSGLAAVNDLLELRKVPVIFITGRSERLLEGERPAPLFVVTKPYRLNLLTSMINQAAFFAAGTDHAVPQRQPNRAAP